MEFDLLHLFIRTCLPDKCFTVSFKADTYLYSLKLKVREAYNGNTIIYWILVQSLLGWVESHWVWEIQLLLWAGLLGQ